jgi:hypothetical protein
MDYMPRIIIAAIILLPLGEITGLRLIQIAGALCLIPIAAVFGLAMLAHATSGLRAIFR